MKMASRSIDLISKKTNLHVQHTFCFCLAFFCTTTMLFCRTKLLNVLVTHYFYGGIVVCVYPIFCLLCSCSLSFFTAHHFHFAGRWHFSLSHRRFDFHVFLPTKFLSSVFNHSLKLFLCYPGECKHQK